MTAPVCKTCRDSGVIAQYCEHSGEFIGEAPCPACKGFGKEYADHEAQKHVEGVK